MNFRSDLLRFRPLYQERVWGGDALGKKLRREIPSGRPIGESWEIVDRPEAQSILAGGPDDGTTLRAFLEQHAADVMGPGWSPARPFPVLVKWLDCRERLSLQVHPPMSVADELRGEPKTENWFIADAEPGAEIIVGLREGVTRKKFEEAAAAGHLEQCVQRFPVSTGDSILIHSGQVHAIGAGNLILEIQENSDTTYRVDDWGRVGLDGKPRELHLASSLRSINWDLPVAPPLRGAFTTSVLADCAEFRIRRVALASGAVYMISPGEQPRIVSVAQGSVASDSSARPTAATTLARGSNVLVPYCAGIRFTAEEPTVLLVTENFAGPSQAQRGASHAPEYISGSR